MPTTKAPPSPPNGPSDWTYAVQGNCFSNIQRLGQWTGGTTTLPAGTDPSSYFQPVTAGSLGGGATPPTIYVFSHGWAPGYRDAVNSQQGNLLWWGTNASVKGAWASEWAWSPVVTPHQPPVTVNPTGLFQSIAANDPTAIVLAWSWIDDSATASGVLNLDEVYASEAYTHVNGLRLANALQQAIASTFWHEHSGLLRIIGHSHGSKVATVAALTLQQRGYPVAHLTILDAPESELTLEANAANLLGCYLEQMQIANPSFDCASGVFIDNYASYFGIGYAGSSNLRNVVEVALDPSRLYYVDEPSDKHSYSAAWYGAAAAGAAGQGTAPVGLAWPPPPAKYLPALNQNWPLYKSHRNQWILQPGASIIGDSFTYETQPLAVATGWTQGNVSGDPASQLIFQPTQGASGPVYSIFQGSYDNWPIGDGYGMAFDIAWSAPKIGDYLVVTMESPELGEQEVLLVMDGQSAPAGKTSVAINSVVSSWIDCWIYIYFIGAPGNLSGQVTVSNFQLINVGSASGYLRARREALVAKKVARRSTMAPRRSQPVTAPGAYLPPGVPQRSSV